MTTACDQATSHKGKNKRSFTMSQKNEAIEYAEKESNRAAAKKYKVDAKRIPTSYPGSFFGEGKTLVGAGHVTLTKLIA